MVLIVAQHSVVESDQPPAWHAALRGFRDPIATTVRAIPSTATEQADAPERGPGTRRDHGPFERPLFRNHLQLCCRTVSLGILEPLPVDTFQRPGDGARGVYGLAIRRSWRSFATISRAISRNLTFRYASALGCRGRFVIGRSPRRRSRGIV